MTVILTGHIDVPPDRLAEVTKALETHIRLTRAEPGCLSFDVTELPGHPGRFSVNERFADAAAYDAHQARSAASEWGQLSAGLPRHYHITGHPAHDEAD